MLQVGMAVCASAAMYALFLRGAKDIFARRIIFSTCAEVAHASRSDVSASPLDTLSGDIEAAAPSHH